MTSTLLLAASLSALLQGQSKADVESSEWKDISEIDFTARVPPHYCEAAFESESNSYELKCPSGPNRRKKIGMRGNSDTLFLLSSSGNYLLVQRNPAGDWSADAIWKARATKGRLEVAGLEWCTPPTNCKDQPCLDWCSPGNGRLDIVLGPEPIKFGRNRYSIQVGNVFREKGVDLGEFRSIIGSFREVSSQH
jgi:hypothetical protein